MSKKKEVPSIVPMDHWTPEALEILRQHNITDASKLVNLPSTGDVEHGIPANPAALQAKQITGDGMGVTTAKIWAKVQEKRQRLGEQIIDELADTFVAGSAGEGKPEEAASPIEPTGESIIPVHRRTAPMSVTEAGVKMGLGSGSGKARRDSARKAMKRLMDDGEIRYEKLSAKKFVFDVSQFPEGDDD